MLTLYGIPNCDSCRKARKLLDAGGADYRFHDLRADGVSGEMLDRWLSSIDWNALLNTRSTTWRGLDEAEKKDLDVTRARNLMLAHPTLIKRPVAESGKVVKVGFSPDLYAEWAG